MPTFTPLKPLEETKVLPLAAFEEADEEMDEDLIEDPSEDEDEDDEEDLFGEGDGEGGKKKGGFDLDEFGEEKSDEF